jgi:hypothetical protein
LLGKPAPPYKKPQERSDQEPSSVIPDIELPILRPKKTHWYSGK